jgi:hypothetical protein
MVLLYVMRSLALRRAFLIRFVDMVQSLDRNAVIVTAAEMIPLLLLLFTLDSSYHQHCVI